MKYQIVVDYFWKMLSGIGVGIASQILHLLKPNLFPVHNSIGQSGYKNKLGLPLIKENDVSNYIKEYKYH